MTHVAALYATLRFDINGLWLHVYTGNWFKTSYVQLNLWTWERENTCSQNHASLHFPLEGDLWLETTLDPITNNCQW